MLEKPTNRDIDNWKKADRADVVKQLKGFYDGKKIAYEYLQAVVKEGIIGVDDMFTQILSPQEAINGINRNELSLDDIQQILKHNHVSEGFTKEAAKFLKKMHKSNPDQFANWSQQDIYNLLFTEDELIMEIRNLIKRHGGAENLDAENLEKAQQLLRSISNKDRLVTALGGNDEALEYLETGVLPAVDVRSIPGIKISIDDLPHVIPKRTQVFIFGLAGSGKTSFLSGLVHYALKERKTINDKKYNPLGFNYVNVLNRVVEKNRLIKRNPEGDFQYFTLDFLNGRKKHPLTFYEMAGETYEKMILEHLRENPTNGYKTLHTKIKEHIFESPNSKIFFLVIDFEQLNMSDFHRNQEDLLLSIISDLESYGVMKTTLSVVLIVTKWDKAPENTDIEEYIKTQFNVLHTFLEDKISQEYRKVFYTYTGYSLGDFEDIMTTDGTIIENAKYVFDKKHSEKVYNWLCDNSTYYK